jgi:hypothetical protein
MFLEIDQVAVESRLWARAKAGDKGAIVELQDQFNGMVLYLHALSCPQDWECVTLRELKELHIVNSVTLHLAR